MEGLTSTQKSMASLSVFRTLFEKKKNIYSVICEFVKDIILQHKFIGEVSVTQIKSALMDDYGFTIPTAVIQTAIKRITKGVIIINKTKLTIEDTFWEENKIDKNFDVEQQKSINNEIINLVVAFIEKQQSTSLSLQEKTDVENAFCSYIIDNQINNKYAKDFSIFIMQHEQDVTLMNQLNEIREAVLLYEGLSYQTNVNQIDSLSNELCIYLETELLFDAMGYNGTLHKELFDEFYDYVRQINTEYRKKKGRDIIKLRYFEETRDDIQGYFSAAKTIVENGTAIDRTKSAMAYICDHSQESYHVVDLQTDFFAHLKDNLHIELDNKVDYYVDDQQKFNIDFAEVLKSIQFTDERDKQRANDSLTLLNKIHIRRGNRPQNVFIQVGYILLSGNSTSLKLAFESSLKHDGCVPLATFLSFLTNRFWCMLNKSLVAPSSLKSVLVMTQARLALSSIVKDDLSKKYNEVKAEMKAKKISEDKVASYIANLRQYDTNPEDIDLAAITAIDDISRSSIEDYIVKVTQAKQELEDNLHNSQIELDNIRQINKEQNAQYAKSIADLQKESKKQIDYIYQKEKEKKEVAYKEDLSKWEKSTQEMMHNRLRKYKLSQIGRIFAMFVLLCIIAGVIGIFSTKKVGNLSLVVQCIIYGAPFVLKTILAILVPKDKIRVALIFLFSKQKQQEYINEMWKEYETTKPILTIESKEEIRDRLNKE